LTLELQFEVSPELNRKDAGVHLLAKEVLRLPHSLSIFEGEGLKDFLLVVAKLLWGQVQIEGTRVEEGPTRTLLTREVWGRGEFWPCLLFRQSSWDQGRRADQRIRYRY